MAWRDSAKPLPACPAGGQVWVARAVLAANLLHLWASPQGPLRIVKTHSGALRPAGPGNHLLIRGDHPVDGRAEIEVRFDVCPALPPETVAQLPVGEHADQRPGTNSPVSPSTTTSGMPPTVEATTGTPMACDSSAAMPSASRVEGMAETAMRRNSPGTSS